MEIQIVKVDESEFAEFRELQVKRRWDWPATFNSNRHGSIWPYITRGYSIIEDRTELQGTLHVLDVVAKKLQLFRSERGRFFIDRSGAYFKDESGKTIQFVIFDWQADTCEPLPPRFKG